MLVISQTRVTQVLRALLLVGAYLGVALLHGCSPTLNWRDIRPAQTPLLALFPCKPEQLERMVTLGAQPVLLKLLVCNAGEAKFTLAHVEAPDAANAAVILGQWKAATLANIGVQSSAEIPFALKGGNALPPSVAVQTNGIRPDGTAVTLHAVWFAAGTQIFQAAVYADAPTPQLADTYFDGLRIQ